MRPRRETQRELLTTEQTDAGGLIVIKDEAPNKLGEVV